jgi:hypothetical protein
MCVLLIPKQCAEPGSEEETTMTTTTSERSRERRNVKLSVSENENENERSYFTHKKASETEPLVKKRRNLYTEHSFLSLSFGSFT